MLILRLFEIGFIKLILFNIYSYFYLLFPQMTTLSKEVTCVGCRRSVESLVQRLYKTGDSALEPLVITEDGVISVSRDHILAPQV